MIHQHYHYCREQGSYSLQLLFPDNQQRFYPCSHALIKKTSTEKFSKSSNVYIVDDTYRGPYFPHNDENVGTHGVMLYMLYIIHKPMHKIVE